MRPGGGLDAKKFQSYTSYQADKLRHWLIYLIAATHNEAKKTKHLYNNEIGVGEEEPPEIENTQKARNNGKEDGRWRVGYSQAQGFSVVSNVCQ